MIKIALVGPSCSGKTRMLFTLYNNPNITTTTICNDIHVFTHNNRQVKLIDTAGGDRYLETTKLACFESDIVFLMYDASIVDPYSLVKYSKIHKKTILLANIASLFLFYFKA